MASGVDSFLNFPQSWCEGWLTCSMSLLPADGQPMRARPCTLSHSRKKEPSHWVIKGLGVPRRMHTHTGIWQTFPFSFRMTSISALLWEDEWHRFLTGDSVDLLICQTSCNAGSVGAEAVSQEMHFVQGIVKFLLWKKKRKRESYSFFCRRSKFNKIKWI